jgi:hypothetical protein
MMRCDELPNIFEGLSVKDIPQLSTRLELISRDCKTWMTIFSCKFCGQLWEEKYVSKGHGEIPMTSKVRSPLI